MRTLNSRFGMIPHKGNITRNENDISSNDDDEVSELDKSLTLNLLSPTVVQEINETVGAIE